MNNQIKILETPRDAMQGLQRIISTEKKVELISALLEVGYDIVDIGSFVSPQVVPQMRDTAEVLEKLSLKNSKSELFVLVVNTKGAMEASKFSNLAYIGFPFSTSPTFLQKNINSDFRKAWKTINEIQNVCTKTKKKFLVYLSMAFGNPYGDTDDPELVFQWTNKLYDLGIQTISLSDINGIASVDRIERVYAQLSVNFPDIEFGIHLHVKAGEGYEKIDGAYRNGCTLFEGVINGLGGCPMTGYELIGNLPTGMIIEWAKKSSLDIQIDENKYQIALSKANKLLF